MKPWEHERIRAYFFDFAKAMRCASTYKAPKGPRLGTTKSSRPIMLDPQHEAHSAYSRQDHVDAYFAHGHALKSMSPETAKPEDVEHHMKAMQHHWQASLSKVQKAEKKAGRTRSGKRVFHGLDAGHHLYADFSSEDHEDAANVHHGHAMKCLASMAEALHSGKKESAKMHHERFGAHIRATHGHLHHSKKKPAKHHR